MFCFEQQKSHSNDLCQSCFKLLDFRCVVVITVKRTHHFKTISLVQYVKMYMTKWCASICKICSAHVIVDNFFWLVHVAIRIQKKCLDSQLYIHCWIFSTLHTNLSHDRDHLVLICLFFVRATRMNNKKKSVQWTIAVKCLHRITKNRLVNKMLDDCYSFVHLIRVNIQIVMHLMSLCFWSLHRERYAL